MKAGQIKTISILLTILMLTSALSGCGPGSKKLLEEKFGPSGVAQAAEFAPYREVEVKVSPQIAPYRVNADLSNIENRGRFEFSPEAQALLAQNAFVVLPQMQQEFFMLYEFNRYDGIPNLITTDAMLHNYHLFFEHLLKSAEENQLRNELQQLNQGMLEASQKQYEALKNSPWENAAGAIWPFFAVGSRLLDPGAKIPQEVIKEAEAELQLIQEHNQTAISPLMTIGLSPDPLESLKEDYTQYIPRGHYTHSENLKSYFQNMMWYGRMTFRLKNEDETRSAVLMTLALKNGLNQASWDKIYQTTSFFVGESDDPGCIAYSNLLEQVYGVESSLNTLISDNEKWQQFLSRAKELQGPAINSIPSSMPAFSPTGEQEIKVFRFMGQRYSIDADIFSALGISRSGENQQGERRLIARGPGYPRCHGSEEPTVYWRMRGRPSIRTIPRI